MAQEGASGSSLAWNMENLGIKNSVASSRLSVSWGPVRKTAQTFQPWDSRFGMPNTPLPLNPTVDQKAVGVSVRPWSSPPPEVWGPNLQVFRGYFFKTSGFACDGGWTVWPRAKKKAFVFIFFLRTVLRVASQVTESLEEAKNSATLQPNYTSLQVLSSKLHLLTQIWLLHPLRCFHSVSHPNHQSIQHINHCKIRKRSPLVT